MSFERKLVALPALKPDFAGTGTQPVIAEWSTMLQPAGNKFEALRTFKLYLSYYPTHRCSPH
jgi:hypothetical protein